LGVLLWSGDRVGGSPLAKYAAQHWVSHAQFENVSTQVQTAMECLFDPGQPHFAMWVKLYDIDIRPLSSSTFYIFYAFKKSGATPLYYAALCGFHDLADHLIVKNLQDVNAQGGVYFRPFVAALAGRHFKTAELLHRNGADSNVQGQQYMRTPLHSAAYYGDLEMVQKLIEYGADIDARDELGQTPLYGLSEGIHLKDPGVVQLLLHHGTDVNARAKDGSTPLHRAASWGAIDVARMLLEHGADVEAKDDRNTTPLYCGRARQHNDIDMTKLLLEYGAK
jgi:ankyrin repeat protein